MEILRGGLLYFVLVFGTGFVLGPIRILWAVPRFGTRNAELMEAPMMLVVIIVAARWVPRRLASPPVRTQLVGIGLLALGFLLVAEFTLVRWVRGLTIHEYLANRDPVAGMVYVLMLVLFAVMPLLVY
jgi:hypothetical protein